MSGVKHSGSKKTNGTVLSVDFQHNHYYPTEGWRTTTPEQQGMDSVIIANTIDSFQKQSMHSMVIIRNGYLVTEFYNKGLDADTPQDIRSVTKSMTSSLVGIALSEHKLKSADQRISEWLPSLTHQTPKNEIMIKHLLTMTSGLEWDDRDDQSSKSMMYSSNWIQAVLGHSSAHQPGTRYNYSNGDAHLLSAVLYKAVKESLFDYAKSRLFAPLGITNVKWATDPQGYNIGAWGMALTTRDMAKLGLLYLKEGTWAGRRIIPKEWIREALMKRVWLNYADGRQGGYGYYWWSKPLAKGLLKDENKSCDMFYAAGSYGQRIFVVPELQLIVAMTAHSNDVEMPEELLNGVIRSIL